MPIAYLRCFLNTRTSEVFTESPLEGDLHMDAGALCGCWMLGLQAADAARMKVASEDAACDPCKSTKD
jgi:hypothetical protein